MFFERVACPQVDLATHSVASAATPQVADWLQARYRNTGHADALLALLREQHTNFAMMFEWKDTFLPVPGGRRYAMPSTVDGHAGVTTSVTPPGQTPPLSSAFPEVAVRIGLAHDMSRAEMQGVFDGSLSFEDGYEAAEVVIERVQVRPCVHPDVFHRVAAHRRCRLFAR